MTDEKGIEQSFVNFSENIFVISLLAFIIHALKLEEIQTRSF
jgi:hypothetical protein